MTEARWVRVRGVVQGVGFRPFVLRLARAGALAGWVRNGDDGVEIHLEGPPGRLEDFLRALESDAPPAARITALDVEPRAPTGLDGFTIRESGRRERPSVRISPDLAVCDRCLLELFDPADPRAGYPYINCTDCGPRYSIILDLPYDRERTTMQRWRMDERCAGEYRDAARRRFHAQPIACPACGPHYLLRAGSERLRGDVAVRRTAALLARGAIVALKGIGGYHLACDARNPAAVSALRDRKFRKEKPFAVMVRDLSAARRLAELEPAAEAMLVSPARPIVLAPARETLPGVAPDNGDLGLMLPYTPLHHLLFAAGAPECLVMTSGNRSSEPIAYRDPDAIERLSGIADAFLVGERPIARRVEDSIVRLDAAGPTILRRSRGYAPGAVATLPGRRPLLAVGADLKNTVTLVVEGQAFASQYIGDLEQYECRQACEETIEDLLRMYRVRRDELVVVRDCHPGYVSTAIAASLGAPVTGAVQHHRAHVASAAAERGAWEQVLVGLSLDGTGYGDDGAIWGGEIFAGSVADGLERVAHFRPAALAGGDGAARHPVQAAAGFLEQILPEEGFTGPPFRFPQRYADARRLLRSGTRRFATTSVGRLFDAAAAVLGFVRAVSYEGQAAVWLEHQARGMEADPYPLPFAGGELDWRPLLAAAVEDRRRGRDPREIARAFHRGLAAGVARAAAACCESAGTDTVAASGGVFQNALLLAELRELLDRRGLVLWTNHAVPPNDGGISLGQAALAALGRFDRPFLEATCTSSPSR